MDNFGRVVQFLIYGGSFAATYGPASGLTSQNIGVSEAGTDPQGLSLQLVGTGRVAEDFTWTGPATASPGGVNAGQDVPIAPPPGIVGTGNGVFGRYYVGSNFAEVKQARIDSTVDFNWGNGTPFSRIAWVASLTELPR